MRGTGRTAGLLLLVLGLTGCHGLSGLVRRGPGDEEPELERLPRSVLVDTDDEAERRPQTLTSQDARKPAADTFRRVVPPSPVRSVLQADAEVASGSAMQDDPLAPYRDPRDRGVVRRDPGYYGTQQVSASQEDASALWAGAMSPLAPPPMPPVRPLEAPAASPRVGLYERIRELQRELEAIDPARVEQFLDECRKASVQGTTEEILAAWQAEIDYRRRSGRTTPSTPSPAAPRRLAQPVGYEEAPGPSLGEGLPELPGAPWDQPTARGPSLSARGSRPTASAEPPRSDAELGHSEGGPDFRIERGADGVRRLPVDVADFDGGSVATRLARNDASGPPATAAPNFSAVQQDLRELAERIEQTAPNTTGEQLRLQVYERMLYLMAGDRHRGLEPLRGVESLDRTFWRHQLDAVDRYFDDRGIPRVETRANEVVEALEEALGTLRHRADLAISPPIFCKEVWAFGSYAQFERFEFSAGQPVVVYWEVSNFASIPTNEGYRTRMEATFEIFEPSGRQVHESQHPFQDDFSQRRRSDYFHAILFELPSDLEAGDYTLRVTVRDRQAEKIAENQRAFRLR